MERERVRARYTGGGSIAYRWAGRVGGGEIVHAQLHPEALPVDDTWVSTPDPRVGRRTMITLPVGTLVIESETKGGSHSYAAGILGPKEIDWRRAQHVGSTMVDVDRADPGRGKRRVHVVVVDGVRGEYAEVDALSTSRENPLAAFSTEELEAELARRGAR